MATATAPTIAQALAAVMADCTNVAKRERNTHFNFQFRGIDAILNAVGPVLRKHGVIVLPRLVDVTYSARGNSSAVQVIVDYAFVGPAGDELVCRVPGEALDTQDKGTAKAMSVAFRVALIQALALPTDEPDPDAHGPYDTGATAAPQAASRPAQAPAPPSALEQAQAAVWAAWQDVRPGGTMAGLADAYTSDHDKPIQSATAAELLAYVDELTALAVANEPTDREPVTA